MLGRLSASFAIIGALTLVPTQAFADEAADPAADKAQCAADYQSAQELRLDKRLLDARTALLACMKEHCPQVAKSHCSEWLAEVEKATPSVVLKFVDGAGTTRSDVRVTVDGKVLTDSLDGSALEIDPGKHSFRFEPAGGDALERELVVAEGQKSQPLSVSLAGPDAEQPGDAPPVASTRDGAGVHPATWAVGALSLVGFGVFAGLGINSLKLADDCSPMCTDEEVDEISVQRLAADVGLGVGVAALAATIAIAVVTYDDGEDAAETAHLIIAPTLGGATTQLRWSF
jgi:hypothetical protein